MSESEYDRQAREFLSRSGTEMEIKFEGIVNGFPFDPSDTMTHRFYHVYMKRGSARFSTPFYGSHADAIKGKDPSEYDILSCLQSGDVADTVEEFAREFGYVIDSSDEFMRVRKIWKQCKTQYEKLTKFFGDEWMAELQEIN